MALLIFDLDGTLVNSFAQITQSANEVRTNLGFQKLSLSTAEQLIGLPAYKLFEDLTTFGVSPSDLVPSFRDVLQSKIQTKNTVYEGVIPFLTACKKEKISTAIATSKPQYLAEMVVNHSELNGLIDLVQGTDDFPPKPDPTVINKVIQRCDDKAIMFGDRPEDMQAANSAGIPAIGVSQSIFTNQMLLEAGAMYSFSSISEVHSSSNSPQHLFNFVTEKENVPKIL